MKFLLFFALIAAVVAVALSSSAYWGQRQYNDELVYSKNVILSPKRDKIQSKDISYSPFFSRRNITAIIVTDNFRNNSGADPLLLKGGLGRYYANIRLTGHRSMGINSTVLIFGKK